MIFSMRIDAVKKCWATLHKKPACPKCKSSIREPALIRFWAGKRVRCQCGKFFTALTGTVFDGYHGSYREIQLFVFLVHLGTPRQTIAAALDRSVDTVRLRLNKLNVGEN